MARQQPHQPATPPDALEQAKGKPFAVAAGARSEADRRNRRIHHELALRRARERARRAAVIGPCVTLAWLILFTMGLTIPSSGYRARLMSLQPAAAATPAPSAIGALTFGPIKGEVRFYPKLPPPAPPGAFGILSAVVMSALTYTPTNLALLCCTSALIGCFGRVATWPDGPLPAAGTAQASATVHTPATPSAPGAPGKPATDTPVTATADAPTPTPAAASETALASIGALAPAITAIMWGFFIYLAMISGMVAITGEPFANTTPEQYLRLAGAASLFAFVVGWRPQVVTQLVSQVGPGRFKGG